MFRYVCLTLCSDCDACGTCQSLSNLSGMALQLQPVWTILYSARLVFPPIYHRTIKTVIERHTCFCRFHTLHIPLPVVLGVWGLQRSNRCSVEIISSTFILCNILFLFSRFAPAAFILYSSALIARVRSAARRRMRRSRASGILRTLSRCFRYFKRGTVAAALNAGKKMKTNRVFPGASDGATSIQISPSMRA